MARVIFGPRERLIVATAAVCLALVGAVVGLTFGLRTDLPPNGGSPPERERFRRAASDYPVENDPKIGSSSRSQRVQLSEGDLTKKWVSAYRTYRFAAITTDTNICSDIGVNILAVRGGSVVDAAIASLLCVGIVNAHSTGIGGGHFATIWAAPRGSTTKELVTLMSRERAPLLAERDMFVDNPGSSSKGGLSIAVPGEIMGMYTAWNRFGLLSWAELVQPAIDLCEQGFTVERDLSSAIKQYETAIRADPNLSELFVKEDGSLVTVGDWLVNPKLGATFRAIQADPMTFYNGPLAQDIVDDIKEYGGIVSLEDLQAYRSSWKPPISVSLENGNYTVYNPPPPCSGAVLNFIVNILDGYNFKPSDIPVNQVLNTHRIIEAFKFAYAKRSELGDEDYVDVAELVANLTSDAYADSIRARINDDQTYGVSYYEPTFDIIQDKGTIHLNVLGADGSAIAMSGTINLFFGSNVRGSRTGIIFNDEMDDFSTPGTKNAFGVPASPSNYIVPGKMPMSSMSPTLVFDESGRVVFMTGASGGTRITTQSAHVLVNSLWFDFNLQLATDFPRVHHQLVPEVFNYETDIDQILFDGLKAKGHNASETSSSSIAVVGSIRNRCNVTGGQCIEAVSDARKGGFPGGY